ncbi:MAG: hypothetical protein HGA42_20980, partial [Nostocales cyanobacterium W4_Combined_metabat2_030]|nr:hypothetical protein [Nostocales cyanobacterium W4_Combined_metabat2_030]
ETSNLWYVRLADGGERYSNIEVSAVAGSVVSASSGLSLATILRNIRKNVVKKYIDNKHENAPLFLHTFMYIYYGNPMTTLEIIPHEDN